MIQKNGRKAGKRNGILYSAVFRMVTGIISCVMVCAVVAIGLAVWKESVEDDFGEGEIVCRKNSPISWEERLTADAREKRGEQLTGLEKGDILVTPCSHTYGWRNGHAAIVIDAEERLTMESVVIGTPSAVQSLDKWEQYPAVMVLRLKGVSAEERGQIADYAAANKGNIIYGFREDVLEHLFGAKGRDTHCSHLVWKTYLEFGYDLDGDGGILVTPCDLTKSPLLEVVQEYGMEQVTGW